jgi:protein-L-isoaspartate(D-aspartate) O-methyltransferase
MANDDPRATGLADELRREGIRVPRILSAIESVPREFFVDAPFAHTAYDNTALPIACGQTISQPYVVAYMTEILEVGEAMRVLEIGTGSGYQAAVLSLLCRRVYTIERHRPLLQEAERRFRVLKIENVVTKLGDGHDGWPEQAPFDRILMTAAAPRVPPALIEQLGPGGILVAPIGPAVQPGPFGGSESICQLLTKIIRTETGLHEEKLIPVVFVPMVAGVPGSAKTGHDLEKDR